jgi:hypothetical protein
MNDDLSDETFGQWCREHRVTNRKTARAAWQACRWRALAMLEEWERKALDMADTRVRKAFEAGFFNYKVIRDYDDELAAWRAYQAEQREETK